MLSERIELIGLRPKGLRLYGERTRVIRSMARYAGDVSSVQRFISRSTGERCNGLNLAASATRFQYASSAARAPSAPPFIQPLTRTAAFIAPADVPEIASTLSQVSSRSLSSTPQVNAPCEPPPCRAKSTRTGSRSPLARPLALFAMLAHPRANIGRLSQTAQEQLFASEFGARWSGPLGRLLTSRGDKVKRAAIVARRCRIGPEVSVAQD